MSAYPKGKRPLCPECGIEYIKERRAQRCQDCARHPNRPKPTHTDPLTTYDEARRLWEHEIGMARNRYAGPCTTQRPHREGTRIAVLPDLHVPFHDPRLLADFIAREQAAHTDKVIAIGDLSDSYALSRFVQYDWMPFRDEWADMTVVMQALSEAFPAIEIVLGNHDVRLEKQLRNRLTLDMIDAIKFMTGGILCPLTALAKQFPNVTIAEHHTPDGQAINWFTVSGDAWLGHPEKFSRVPGSALRATEEWLADNEVAFGLSRYRLIVMGHSHQLALVPWRSGQLLVESGCLCKTQGYMVQPKIGGRPQKRGWIWFEQDAEGATDLNSVGWYWCDVATPSAG